MAGSSIHVFLLLVLGAYAVVTSLGDTEADATTTGTPDVPTQETSTPETSADVALDPPSSEGTSRTPTELLEEVNERLAKRLQDAMDKLESSLSQNMNMSLAIRLDSFVVNTTQRLDSMEKSVEEITKSVSDFKDNMSQQLTTIEESLRSCDLSADLMKVSEGLEQLSGTTTERLSKIESELPNIARDVSTTAEELLANTTSIMKGAISDAIESFRGNTLEPKAAPTKYFLYVDNFSEFAQNATISPVVVYSDIMVVAGYSSKIIVQLKKFQEGIFLGLHFSLCPGANDSYLEWPFKIPYSLSVVHPTSTGQAISRNFSMGKAKEEYALCFTKPKKHCNCAYGYDAIASLSTLKSDGYDMADAITVALTLNP